MTVKLLVGDTRERIKEIPDGDIDFLCCSPPFLALRKYGDNAAAEMGSERTPADFLDALLELTAGEFRRVLAPHGSLAIELGDTYSGSGGAGGDYGEGGLRDGQRKFDGSNSRRGKIVDHDSGRRNPGPGWPLAKSLTLIPTLYPASLAYGWNMLNPAHTFDRWRVRNVIVWARPNPPVGALGDKVRPATSYITVACTSAKRWFDLDAVREPFAANTLRECSSDNDTGKKGAKGSSNWDGEHVQKRRLTHDGAPPLDWWEDDDPTGHATLVLPTQPYPGAHYATWPETLAARLIKMMCPLRVCTTCGEPSRRITKAADGYAEFTGKSWADRSDGRDKADGRERNSHSGQPAGAHITAANYETLGWSDCGHNTWRPGRVLDPFAGSGTTLAVAQGLGRDAVGIELYEANAHLVRDRVGMFLEMVDGPPREVVVDAPDRL